MELLLVYALSKMYFCSHLMGLWWCVLQDSAQEAIITRDIHRTFPAHDYFKDSDGDGQDSLYKICKVTSIQVFFAFQHTHFCSLLGRFILPYLQNGNVFFSRTLIFLRFYCSVLLFIKRFLILTVYEGKLQVRQVRVLKYINKFINL